jgi:Uncharacterized conserved protein (DUF2075)
VPAIYRAPVHQFLSQDEDAIVGRQSAIASAAFTELAAEQLQAWREQIRILQSALIPFSEISCHLLLEYPIPRRGKRIDAVLILRDLILVLEFKCGAERYDLKSRIQLEDYCLDLRDFHPASRRRVLVPVLIATQAADCQDPKDSVADFVAPVWLTNAHSLARSLEEVFTTYHCDACPPIDPEIWDNAEYAPTPTIVEAARVLYEGQNVREISRCHAGAENLTRTSAAVIEAIRNARDRQKKLICFITGVPGAGKTLAGLNIVHNRELHDGSLGVFLSGNGPLVRVLREALARDNCARTGQSPPESRRRVQTFIDNVHRFIDAHHDSTAPPPDRVIVFDEAQRAWTRDQSYRKFKRNRSEPEIVLDIMNRHQGWAVVVALVGSGQEINTGEAGLSEWGRALAGGFPHWTVMISPELATSRTSSVADSLFETQPVGIAVAEASELHLNVPLRSYKAQAVSEFVSCLLRHELERARSLKATCSDFPIVMTRHLDTAREWLRRRQRGSRRIGLIASSGGRRLRACGLDVRTELDVENWFLNDRRDVRSSFYLETPATEFGIQGLELDWTGLCWDIDLVPAAAGWQIRAFKGTEWQTIRDATRRRYVLNKYRVLLTRAREGMVIWVPTGDPADWTRPPSTYDSVARYLESCGIAELSGPQGFQCEEFASIW